MNKKLNRWQRRQSAKVNKIPFEPQYNGRAPITKEQYITVSQESKEREEA